jgi:hypothetical protein
MDLKFASIYYSQQGQILETTEIGSHHISLREWSDEVKRLARERDAIILAHNYQRPEIQDVADHVGDSLALSRIAAQSSASTIVFAGVYFMAETAKILAPERTVLIPEPRAGCSLADSIDADQLREWKSQHTERSRGSVSARPVPWRARAKSNEEGEYAYLDGRVPRPRRHKPARSPPQGRGRSGVRTLHPPRVWMCDAGTVAVGNR